MKWPILLFIMTFSYVSIANDCTMDISYSNFPSEILEDLSLKYNLVDINARFIATGKMQCLERYCIYTLTILENNEGHKVVNNTIEGRGEDDFFALKSADEEAIKDTIRQLESCLE